MGTAATGMRERNAAVIEAELAWFQHLLETRLRLYFQHEEEGLDFDVEPPRLGDGETSYARLVEAAGLGTEERLILILAAIPSLRPQALDTLLLVNKQIDRAYTEFGNLAGPGAGVLPSWQMALFLLAADEMPRRLASLDLFDAAAPLRAHRLLRGPRGEDRPAAIPLRLRRGALARLMGGEG